MKTMTTILNKQLANWLVLEMKVRNYHWHVKGPHFFTLHAKFQELYTEAALHIDILAERVRVSGDEAVSTLTEALAVASVQEGSSKQSAQLMTASIASDFRMLIEELGVGMQLAESIDDEVSRDMLLAIHESLQKHVWMLEVFLSE